jgi:hypothetical protein
MWFYCNELKILVKSLEQVEEMYLANYDFEEITSLVANVLIERKKNSLV